MGHALMVKKRWALAVETMSSTIAPRIFGGLDRIAGALGIFRRPLSAAELTRLAQRRTGLTDFGDTSFEEPLEVLVRSYEAEANLSTFGRVAARWDALRFLSNLLILREAEKKTPAILDQSIDRPIFITGLPRSGTTFLHDLLCRDPSNRVVRCWETIYPYPEGGNQASDADRRRAKVDRQLAGFARLAPEIRSLHPMTAHSPQECTEITAHVFRSLRFDTTHYVPSYRHWLDNAGHLAAYRFHKRFLQHLQHQKGPGRWILKCPDHVFALEAIREVYPDARFVFMHRDPLEVLASVARLTHVLRSPFTRRVDRLQIGRQVSEHWARGAATLIDAAEGARESSDRFFHLKFRSFIRDPFGGVAALYEHFGLDFSEEFAARLRSTVAERPNGGYGRNKGRLDQYGLDAQAQRQHYRDYLAYFGV
jgi:hypothetical protein